MPTLLHNVTHWRNRAEEARADAGQFTDREAERIMRTIAEGYDKLVQHAEHRAEPPELNPTRYWYW
jgi:hypothetical protein